MSFPRELTLVNKEKFDNLQFKVFLRDLKVETVFFEDEVAEMYRMSRINIHLARSVRIPDPPVVLASMPARAVPR